MKVKKRLCNYQENHKQNDNINDIVKSITTTHG